MRSLLLILNPQAGRKESRLRLFDLVEFFSRHDFTVTVHPTRRKSDATHFVQAYAGKYDVLLCCGGDGTLNEVITGLMSIGKKPEVGYIPAGTTNDMAASLRLPRRLLKAAEIILGGKSRMHDIGSFNSGYFVYAAAFGAFTSVSYLTPQPAKSLLGRFAYVLEGIRRLPEIRPYKMNVIADEQNHTGDFIFGAVTNTHSIAGIKNPMPGVVLLNDGKFEVLLVKNPDTPNKLRLILMDLGRRKYENENIIFFQTSHIEFHAEEEVPWTIDGEDGGMHQKVEVQNLPSSVRFCIGSA